MTASLVFESQPIDYDNPTRTDVWHARYKNGEQIRISAFAGRLHNTQMNAEIAIYINGGRVFERYGLLWGDDDADPAEFDSEEEYDDYMGQSFLDELNGWYENTVRNWLEENLGIC